MNERFLLSTLYCLKILNLPTIILNITILHQVYCKSNSQLNMGNFRKKTNNGTDSSNNLTVTNKLSLKRIEFRTIIRLNYSRCCLLISVLLITLSSFVAPTRITIKITCRQTNWLPFRFTVEFQFLQLKYFPPETEVRFMWHLKR